MSTITPDDAVTAADLATEIAEIRGQLREFNARHQPPQQAPRPLHEIGQDARRVNCGQCWQVPGLPCTTHRETGDDGYHVARLDQARRRGLISEADFGVILVTAGVFTSATIIYDTPDGAR
jgi:hypothetical protein